MGQFFSFWAIHFFFFASLIVPNKYIIMGRWKHCITKPWFWLTGTINKINQRVYTHVFRLPQLTMSTWSTLNYNFYFKNITESRHSADKCHVDWISHKTSISFSVLQCPSIITFSIGIWLSIVFSIQVYCYINRFLISKTNFSF